MNVVETIEQVRRLLGQAASAGRTLALVPTMGAMHDGHYSLIDAARAARDFVAVSIFVNPNQFGPNEDIDAYPRDLDSDVSGCEAHGADLVFAPSAETMYGRDRDPKPLTSVTVERLCERLCGQNRPGHFAGVCTVVAKLFSIFQPDKAFFGAKDFQQSVIVRRMAADLNFPVEIVLCPTVREPDGLAMSSRNNYLTPDQRIQAPALYHALQLGVEMIRRWHRPAGQVIAAMRDHLASEAPDGRIDYVQIVDPVELCDVENTDRRVLAALAVRFGAARLIDNALVD